MTAPLAVRRCVRHTSLLTAPWVRAFAPMAKSAAASANSIAAVVLQLSTIAAASASTLGAGRSAASMVLDHSQAEQTSSARQRSAACQTWSFRLHWSAC